MWFTKQEKVQKFNLYREWQYLGQGFDKSSMKPTQQLSCWLIFIDQFERALDTGMEIY